MWQGILDGFGQLFSSLGSIIESGFAGAQIIALHVYTIIAKQYFIYGLQTLLKGVVWISLGIVLIRLNSMVIKKLKPVKLDETVMTGIVVIVTGIVVYIGLTTMIASLTYLLNPEYYAIQDSVNLIKSLLGK